VAGDLELDGARARRQNAGREPDPSWITTDEHHPLW